MSESHSDDTGAKSAQKRPRDLFEKLTLGTAIAGVLVVVVSLVLSQHNEDSSSAQVANAINQIADLAKATNAMSTVAGRQETDENQLARSAGHQATAAQGQLTTSQDTANRQLRAYVYALPTPVTDFEADKAPAWGVSIYAMGQTPAYDARSITHVAVMAYPTADFASALKGISIPTATRAVLFPGAPFVEAVHITYKLTASQLEIIKNGNMYRLYTWGRVDYRDAFHTAHFTEYCFSYSTLAGGQAAPEGCPGHNRTDD